MKTTQHSNYLRPLYDIIAEFQGGYDRIATAIEQSVEDDTPEIPEEVLASSGINLFIEEKLA